MQERNGQLEASRPRAHALVSNEGDRGNGERTVAEQRTSAVLYPSWSRAVVTGRRTAYGATMPKAAKLTLKGHSQVPTSHGKYGVEACAEYMAWPDQDRRKSESLSCKRHTKGMVLNDLRSWTWAISAI